MGHYPSQIMEMREMLPPTRLAAEMLSMAAQIAGRLRDKCLAGVLFFGFSAYFMGPSSLKLRMALKCLGTEKVGPFKVSIIAQ